MRPTAPTLDINLKSQRAGGSPAQAGRSHGAGHLSRCDMPDREAGGSDEAARRGPVMKCLCPAPPIEGPERASDRFRGGSM
jgi:hypothetical protein